MMTEQEEFEFRLRFEQENAVPTAPTSDNKNARNRVPGVVRGIEQFESGISSLPRGLLNLISGNYKLGSKLFTDVPKEEKDTVPYIAGQVFDPSSFGVGAKIAQGVAAIPKLAGRTGVQNILGGTAAGATIGGLSDSENRLAGLAAGAGGGALAGAAVPAVIAGSNAIGNIIGPALSEKSAQKAAARLMNEAARGRDVVGALRSGKAGETAAQSATRSESAEATSLLDMMRGYRGSEYAKESVKQEAARMDALKNVTPDLKAVEEARDLVGKINYGTAFASDKMRREAERQAAQVGISKKAGLLGEDVALRETLPKQLQALTGNPIISAAEKEARILAQSLGHDADVIANPMGTLEGLHLMKLAIDNQFKNRTASTALQNYSDAALQATKEKLVSATEKVSPLYKQARRMYQSMSPEVDQAQVLGRMQGILDSGAGAERVTPFLNALGSGEQALLKRATGFPRYESGDLSKVLTQGQKSVVDDIVSQMRLDQELKRLSSEGRTGALKAMRAVETTPNLPNLMTWKVSLPNAILNRIEGKGGQKVNEQLAELGLPTNKKKLADLMEQQVKRKILMEQIIQGGAGGLGGLLGNVTAD